MSYDTVYTADKFRLFRRNRYAIVRTAEKFVRSFAMHSAIVKL